ncbi:MAG: DUF4340 domain-containing protein [Acidobacteria bacterium]|nr:DUF4340 domain-containing protein [Acidobacteriota bacterium]MBU4307551.1 DUF4340 domain-containing protein [Acidobacteriota bacterium]MCG2811278.1 DUF4340 domain-containing protein [Candidatus Aminicenantes bacterium]
MNWKKIIALLLFLLVLISAIVLVDQHEKRKMAVEGILLDFPAAAVEKIELLQTDKRFVFALQDGIWRLTEPLKAKADKVALESILDNFCPLKYDRLVAEAGGDLKNFGLNKPEIELRLFAKDKTRPAHTILLGMKNNLDSSSYAKLVAGAKVVSIASYKRNNLEKDLFAFRDKRFSEFDNLAVTNMTWQYENNGFDFYKKNDQWFMDKPIFSLAQETKVSEILSAASMLEAKSFAAAVSAASRREFGLETPLLTVEFRSVTGSKKIVVAKQGERYYALANDFNEICEIEKDFLEKFSSDASSFREKKVALFYSFDIRELKFQHGTFSFEIRKGADNGWQFIKPSAGKKLNEEKISLLLTALADCEAREFVDNPKTLPEFATRIAMKAENSANPGHFNSIIMEFGAADGETVMARNPALPYWFKVGKEILQKLPQKMEDITEETQNAQVIAK